MTELYNSAELAEKARKDAFVKKVDNLEKVTEADLDGNFIVIKDVTDYGDLFVSDGDFPLVFGVVNGNIYKLHYNDADKFTAELADPTKGKLVVELDKANKKINWLQDHIEQQPFESFNSLRSAKYYGDDAGLPLLNALQAHIHGTYNISGYDTRLVSLADLASDIKKPASASPVASDPKTGVETPKTSVEPKTASLAKPETPQGDGKSGK